MWTWMFIVGGYVLVVFLFRLLGGVDAASRAIQEWGRSTSERALEESGESAASYARARVSRR